VEPADFDAVAVHLSPVLADLARFAYAFGWRKMEVCELEWRSIDMGNGKIRLSAQDTKNESSRTVSISPEVRAILERRQAARSITLPDGTVYLSPYVFHRGGGKPIRDFRAAWDAACEAAGRSDLLFHDLRRSGARNLIRAGVPEKVAMRVTGHKTRAMFDRYDITSERDVEEAAEKVQAYVDARREAAAKVVPIGKPAESA
jgi:integrase